MGTNDKHLSKAISPLMMWAAAAGMLIGPWLVVTTWFFSLSGPSLTLACLITGVLMIPIAMLYGEMVSMLPAAGGSYHFTANAFGSAVGFSSTWMIGLAYMGLIAFNVTAPIFIMQAAGWLPETELVRVFAAVLLAVIFGIINYFKVELTTKIQFIMVAGLLVAGLLVNGVLLFFSGGWTVANLQPFFSTGTGGFMLSVGLLSNLYFGFEAIPQLVEEAKYPPKKNVKVILVAIGTAWLIYSVAFLGISGCAPLSWILEHELSPAEVLLYVWKGNPLGVIGFTVAMIVGALGATTGFNGFWIALNRLFYALGRAKIFPRRFSNLNKHKSPGFANWVSMSIIIVLILISGSDWIQVLYVLMTLAIAIVYCLDSLAFIALRKKHPDWPRPYKLKSGMVVGFLALAASAFCLFWCVYAMTGRAWIIFIIYLILGVIVYLKQMSVLKKENEKPFIVTPSNIDEANEIIQEDV